MGKGSAPKAPDPRETASAQTGTNIGTAIANSYLGNINQKTPDGSLTYKQTGTQKWTDPMSGKVYNIPTMTAVQSLSLEQQKLKNKNDVTQSNLANTAMQQSKRLGSLLNKPFTLDGLPAAGDAAALKTPSYTQFGAGPQLQTSLGNTGQIKSSIDGAGEISRTIADAGKIHRSITSGGNIQNQVGDAGAITRTYGANDYGANVKEVQDALLARINPSLDQGRTALETKLANQGITIGSAAYDAAMKNQGQQENDARYGAILNANQEQSRLANLEAQKAGFENAAQQQAFQQKVVAGEFANAAQAQRYGQNANNAQFSNAGQAQQYSQNASDAQFRNAGQAQQFQQNAAQTSTNNSAQQQAYQQALASGQFSNDALQQMFGNQNTTTAGNNALQDQAFNADQAKLTAQNNARSQALNEAFAARNQPLNEISGLLSGSQITSPSFVPTQGQSIPTVDYAGLVNQNYANQMGAYNAKQAQTQGLLGGLFGLGSSAIMASDERVKTDIEPIGDVKGHPIYEYRYTGKFDDGKKHVGVMAQEVERKRPDAVMTGTDGVKRVHYGKLFDIGRERLAA